MGKNLMAANFVSGHRTVSELATALGIDIRSRHITAIAIEASIRSVTKITIQEIMDIGQHNGVCEVIKKYRLDPIDSEKREPASEPAVRFREFT